MPKIDRIIQLLETRIARGDYAMTPFPTEYGLAEEMIVGRMTARRAILRLVEKGLLYRDTTGRPYVTTERSAERPLQIGFVTATLTAATLRWQRAAEQSVLSIGGHMRVITYFHWDDPTLLEGTESFDGVFLIPPAELLPPQLAERLLKSRARLVVLGADYWSRGFRSIDIVPSESVATLLDYLSGLGHHQIAVLNTQPLGSAIDERLDKWQAWITSRGFGGELINEPERSYGDPMERAYRVAKERLSSGVGLGGTAVLCTTMPATLGLMRACNEQGLIIGRDISICTVNDEGLGPFLSPKVTCTRTIDPKPLLHECLDWMAGGQWDGPLLKRASEVELFIGGSTGPISEQSAANRSASSKNSPGKPDDTSFEENLIVQESPWNENRRSGSLVEAS